MDLNTYIEYFMNRNFSRFLEEVSPNSFEYIGKYFTEMMENEIHKIRRNNPCFLKAPTGAGKTTFFEDFISENSKYTFLFLCNRTTLCRQMKMRLFEKLEEQDLKECLTMKGIDKIKKIKNVYIMTYQALLSFLEKEQIEVDYILADEVHTLYGESLYIPTSFKILKAITKMNYARRIYISATPENIFPIILEMELNGRSRLEEMIGLSQGVKPIIPVYYEFIQVNKKVYDLIYFYSYCDLIEKIKDNKGFTLIFVETIKKARYIKELLMHQTNKKISILSSYSKEEMEGHEDYESISEQEAFKSDIVISTAVISEGVNLKMENLDNIVLTDYSYERLLQSLGRKRLNNVNKSTKVYIKILSKSEINEKIHELEISRAKIYHLKKMKKKEIEYLITKNELDMFAEMFYFEDGKFKVNPLAIKYCDNNIEIMKMLKSAIDEYPLVSAVLASYYINPTKTVTIYENQILESADTVKKGITMLEKLLNDNLNEPMDKMQREKIFIDFKEIFSTYLSKKINNVRLDRAFGRTTINKIIKVLNLPYEIRLNGKITIIKSIGGESNE